jgi:calcium-dependent protein kinase
VKIHPNGPLGAKSKKGSVLGRTTSDINDIFTFHEELGKGQFGTTYKIKNKKTGEEYACKAIAKRKLTAKEDIDDVRREISILHHLGGHDNIVCCEGAYEGARHVYIVMELLQGGELFDRIVERGKYSEKDAADCFRTIVETIQHCHELGVVHRDLKPENFVLKSRHRLWFVRVFPRRSSVSRNRRFRVLRRAGSFATIVR